MLLEHQNLRIRNAVINDAELLKKWWNDGNIMAHAGFPNGTGETESQIAATIKTDSDDTRRRLIVELSDIPIGEMSYYNVGEHTAEIGIKICDFSLHDQGLGKILLSMLISALFDDWGYTRIILDTNAKNHRAQHVYEQLGFKKIAIRENSWKNQLGELQSSVDYELYPKDFISFCGQ